MTYTLEIDGLNYFINDYFNGFKTPGKENISSGKSAQLTTLALFLPLRSLHDKEGVDAEGINLSRRRLLNPKAST